MRILVVAPDMVGVDAINEVRRIQQWHDVATLYGTVTADDIYRTIQEKAFDVIHFATHGGAEGVQLSGGALLDAETIAQFVRLRESSGVFFSACATGRLAAYCVRHGARWAISSEVELLDAVAWKLAAAFYSHQRNGHTKDFVGAYLLADSGDGDYALHVSPMWVQELQRRAETAGSVPHTTPPLSRAEALWWGVGLALGSASLGAALTWMAGRY